MVLKKLKKIISQQFDVDEASITEDTEFQADLGADSLDVVELAMSVEAEFGLGEIQEEDIRGVQTVGDLAAYIQKELG